MKRPRWMELVALFAVAPAGLALLPARLVLPAILGGAALCLVLLLRDPTFHRGRLWRGWPERALLPGILLRVAAAAVLGTASLWAFAPERLLSLPRQNPGLWAFVMIAYPVFSVFPQELVFRVFFHHRYQGLFPRARARVLASALAFGWAHVVLHNGLAVALTVLGGALFARTYERSGSLRLTALEHALHGCLMFTLGLGSFFYAGAR